MYYHLRSQKFSTLQKVKRSDIFFLQHEKFVARDIGNTCNTRSTIAARQLLCDKLQENVAILLGLTARAIFLF